VTEKDDTEVTNAGDAESTAVELDSADESAQSEPELTDDRSADVAERPSRGLRSKVAVVALAVALLASVGAASWLYFFQFRPDQQTDADAAKVAVDAATEGSVALLSYSPETLEQNFTAAKSRLTGDFLTYYTQFTEQVVTPAAKQKAVKTEAAVVQAAVSELQPDSAEVLLFINQTTTSKENPDGAYAASAVKVGLTKIDGAWLISAFDPV
jgi:Mce-associated membrane protein